MSEGGSLLGCFRWGCIYRGEGEEKKGRREEGKKRKREEEKKERREEGKKGRREERLNAICVCV